MIREALARWDEALRELAAVQPVPCEVWSHTLGEVLPFDGYTLGMECRWPAHRLYFELTLSKISSGPVVEFARVFWQGQRHYNYFRSPWKRSAPVTAAELDAVRPRFLRMLERQIRYGRPLRGDPPGMMMGSVSQTEVPAPDVKQATGEEPDYEVYSALVRHLLGNQPGSPLLLVPVVMTLGEPASEMVWHPPGQRLANRETVSWLPTEDSDDPYERQRFALHPRSPATFCFSRVRFSTENKGARVDFLQVGVDDHFIGQAVLTREDNGWVLQNKVPFEDLEQPDPTERSQTSFANCLTGAGYVIEELQWSGIHDGRALLRKAGGDVIQVASWWWLQRQVFTPCSYYCGSGPTLVVPRLDSQLVLEALT